MSVRRLLLALSMLAPAMAVAWAEDRAPPLDTNAAEIVELLHDSPLAIYHPLAVFSYVLGRLPKRVQIYPTENYFYFHLTHQGVRYGGNIRLAAANRDQGKVVFAYGEKPTDWNSMPKTHHVVLGEEQGVKVEKLDPLLYRVSHAGKSVVFALNDLSQVTPPAGFLSSDEKYLGPVFDESGIRFFFVFNGRLRIFHFLLDETVPLQDQLVSLKAGSSILIGKRTGFAFYQLGQRKVLIGADARQSRLNTYFDGPFDQLPENFMADGVLRDAIVAADPGAKGQIDGFGNFLDGSGRYLINPYMLYREPADLLVFQRCVTSKAVPESRRPACFVIDNDEAQRRHPRPLALKRR